MRFSDALRESVTNARHWPLNWAGFGKIKRMNRSIGLVITGLFALLHMGPALARDALVCTVTNRLPDHAFLSPDVDDTRIFTITAELVEERGSGTSLIRQWAVVEDDPTELRAAGLSPVTDMLIIDRRGNTFVESGLNGQMRGYCRINDLP